MDWLVVVIAVVIGFFMFVADMKQDNYGWYGPDDEHYDREKMFDKERLWSKIRSIEHGRINERRDT